MTRFLRDPLPADLELRQEQPLTFEKSELEPDIAVVPRREDDTIQDHPGSAVFVIEVAVSSQVYDREKANVYAAAGIPEYWIVNADLKEIEVYKKPGMNRYNSRDTFSFADSIALPMNGELIMADL